VAVTPDGKRAVSGSDDQTLNVWDLETFATDSPLLYCGVASDGTTFIAGGKLGEVHVLRLDGV
jgi:WD40 repeat protein